MNAAPYRSVRDGPPLPRERVERVNVVGAQPWSVDYGQALGLVRAYAERVNTLVNAMRDAVEEWAREIVSQGRSLTDDEMNFIFRDWPLFHAAWEAHYVQVNDPLMQFVGLRPMSSEEAWQKTETFEERLKALRSTFETLTKKAASKVVAPPDPGPLETAPGQPTPGVLDDLGKGVGNVVGAIPWTTIILGVGLTVGAAIALPRVLGH